MPYRATQNGRVMVESSDTIWSTGEGNGKPLHYSCLENPMNSMKRRGKKKKKDLTRLQSNSLQAVSVIIYKLILKFKRKFIRQNSLGDPGQETASENLVTAFQNLFQSCID